MSRFTQKREKVYKNVMNIYKNRDQLLKKTSTNVILVFMFFLLSHILFLQRYDFLSNEFLNNYLYLVIVNMLIILISSAVTTGKEIRTVYVIILICMFIFLIIYSLFLVLLSGLAKAHINGY
ncbi:hypothetical protein [uncultured Chryseobacterium sp.]|uniref:hypothetical protein n=1 Tax=uncultured Chryseobacterium sp. TaxID=259322 RepID=UPI0027DB4196|nr:hypothetical protein [uncultured Chryseobacterium sp.]